MKVQNRTFIVSGGSSGLGLATVQDLLAQNGYIAILDRNPPPEETQLSSNSSVKFIQLDIVKVDEIQAAVDAVVAWTNQTGAPLGGVINCAGIGVAAKMINARNELHPVDLWDLAMAINVTGSFNLTRLALPHLITVKPEDTSDGERGVIIFVSSSAAFDGQPGQAAYAATKGAVMAMTLPMARDLARHAIRVVSIAPGAFKTPMTSVVTSKASKSIQREYVYPTRSGRPEEFAKTVRWILDCAYVNGETIRLSGAARLPSRL